MIAGSDILDEIRAALAPHGLFLRGVAQFGETEQGPPLGCGHRAETVVLIGNIGGSLWPAFRVWYLEHPEIADPLDAWSKATIRPVAASVCAEPFFPSDPPWQPFQQWAMRAEGLKPSPLGILIHPRYGLWHGYRGALAFAERLPIDAGAVDEALSPCEFCPDKPCLSICPAGAIAAAGFDVRGCRTHLATPAGHAGCMQEGCMARNACPVGVDYRYPREQRRFHMAALSV